MRKEPNEPRKGARPLDRDPRLAAQGALGKRPGRFVWGIAAAVAVIAVGSAIAVTRTHATQATARVARTNAATAVAPQNAEGPARGRVRLASLTGQQLTFPSSRPTLLYFMSASCSTCWQGTSQIAQIWPEVKREAQVISLDVTPQVDTPGAVEQMVQETGARWPQAFATPTILNRYHIAYLDTVVILSPTGRVVYNGAIPSNGEILRLLGEAGAGSGKIAAAARGLRPKPVNLLLHAARSDEAPANGVKGWVPPCC